MKYNSIIITLAAIFMLALTGCKDDSPKAVAEQYLNSFYHMEYEGAREVATEDAIQLIDLMEQFATQQPDSVKKSAKKINVDILDVKEDGDNAEVTYSISTEPGEQTLKLVKQNGKWLVAQSKQDGVDETMSSNEEI